MANLMYIFIIFLLNWLPTEAILTLTGSNWYIESNEDFVLNCFTNEDPSIPRALIYKDNVHIVTLTYQLGNCYADGTLCSVTKMCDCNIRNYSLTFNGVIQNQSVLFECRVQFPGVPIIWKNSTITLFLATIPTSDPAITIDPTGPIDNEGAVTMTCEVEGGIPLANISWKCPGLSIVTVSQNVSANKVFSTVQLTVNRTHNGKLCICEANHTLWKPMRTATKTIVVYYGPESVILSPIDTQYTVIEGSNGPSISCTADCIPLCNYTWSGPGVPTGTTNVLSLQNINQYQTGVFNCTAHNVVGRLKSLNVNIDVQFGPGSSVQFDPSNTSVTKNKGEQFGPITCTARCNPPCQYTWTKPDTTTVHSAQLVIASLSIADHGKFICTASNTIRESQNKSLDVTINYGPVSVTLLPPYTHYNVTEGSGKLLINCTADCRPVCSYVWSGHNVPDGTTNVLSLQNIQKSQAGVFNCTATNKIRSMRSSNVKLNVRFGPGSSLQFEPSNTSITKQEGDKLGPIECRATCNPQCHYKWTKPDKTVLSNGTLDIESLSTEDNGTFICLASNGFGISQNKTIDVTVNYGPVAAILSPSTKGYTVVHGDTIPPINCTAACRPECKYMWSGPNVPSDTANILSLEDVQKNQRGDFNCTAYNVVGSIQSSVVSVNVLYEPSVNDLVINGSNFTVKENSTVLLSCTFEGNPAPHNIWEKNNIILSQAQENNGQSLYTIQPVQCEDNGNYSCVANNSFGMSSAQETLYVTCSPRLNLKKKQPNKKVGLPKGSDLSLTVHLLAYPTPISTVWIFNDTKGNELNIASDLKTYAYFKHVTFLNKTNLTQYDFGDYILKVENSLGSESLTYHVVPQGPPDPATILNVSCGVQTAVLYWRTSFNGGETQQFSIMINKYGKEMYIYDTGINGDDDEQIKHVSIKLTAGEYLFVVYGKNNYGNSNSTESNLCQVTEFKETVSEFAVGAAAGGGTAAAIVIILAIVLFVFIKKRRSLKGDDGRRNLTTEDRDDNDELKENPLYVTSGETTNENAQLYGVVNKKSKSGETYTTENVDQGPVYSEVRKGNAKGKAEKDMEMGSVYENSKDLRKNNDNDEVYANAVNNTTADNIYRPKKNKDGLIYADLDLSECAGEKKFVIRGLENRNNYAIIDLTKKAEPLPSDDDEDEQKSD